MNKDIIDDERVLGQHVRVDAQCHGRIRVAEAFSFRTMRLPDPEQSGSGEQMVLG